jgi:NAD(P)-dependent dehydrogenase (short-subunit alcohol dehydrogenase family)
MNFVIIGADKGLGEVLSKFCLEKGHKVAVGLLADESGKGTSWENVKDDNLLLLHTDVVDEDSVKAAAAKVKDAFGEVDVLVDVAGVLLPSDRQGTLFDTPIKDFMFAMQVNAAGIISVFREFYPVMKKGGYMYAITSEGGSFSLGGALFPAYGITKTAANKVVQIMRETIQDVEVAAIHPGRMNTEMGRTTFQIEPIEAAEGIYALMTGEKKVDLNRHWFIDYKGEDMPL